jgi:hypothetical protein
MWVRSTWLGMEEGDLGVQTGEPLTVMGPLGVVLKAGAVGVVGARVLGAEGTAVSIGVGDGVRGGEALGEVAGDAKTEGTVAGRVVEVAGVVEVGEAVEGARVGEVLVEAAPRSMAEGEATGSQLTSVTVTVGTVSVAGVSTPRRATYPCRGCRGRGPTSRCWPCERA